MLKFLKEVRTERNFFCVINDTQGTLTTYSQLKDEGMTSLSPLLKSDTQGLELSIKKRHFLISDF